jgi:hypothetical protein
MCASLKEKKETKRKEAVPHSLCGRKNRKEKGRESFKLFLTKIAIYEDLTVGSSIRFRKRDPCTRIYVRTDCFKVGM